MTRKFFPQRKCQGVMAGLATLAMLSASIFAFDPAAAEAMTREASSSVSVLEANAADVSEDSLGEFRAELEKGMLRVVNRTPFVVILYVSGVRVGWIRPQRVAQIRGLQSGKHKIYAHSQYGSGAWGPLEFQVAGTWNIQAK